MYKLRRSNNCLFGILDEVESGAYNLNSGNKNQGTKIDMNNTYKMFLAELVILSYCK